MCVSVCIMVREKKTCVCAQRCRDRGSVSPPPLLEWSPERGGGWGGGGRWRVEIGQQTIPAWIYGVMC